MWSMTVQNVVGERIDVSVEHESLQWLEGLCRVNSELLQRFVGLYEFGRDDTTGTGDGDRHTIYRDVPWAGDPRGEYTPSYGFIGEYEAVVMEKAERADRQWMHRVFERLCVDVVAAADVDIAEALAAKVKSLDREFAKLKEMRETPQPGGQMDQLVSKMINDGKTPVASAACLHICEDSKKSFGGKKKKKKKVRLLGLLTVSPALIDVVTSAQI